MRIVRLIASWAAGLPLMLAPLAAQSALSLREAIELARSSHPAIEAAQAREKQGVAGVREARAGYLPRVDFSESWQRSNNPVFVFGSLLNQGQFGERNFAIESLNNPDGLNNFQSRFNIRQVIFDGWRTKRAIQAANLGHDIAEEQRRTSESEVILGVVRTYFGTQLAAESLGTAEESLRSAQSDLERARSMFEAGMTTEADVLSVEVHRAAVEQERIRAEQNAQVARAAMNDALGMPLDSVYELTTPLNPLEEEAPPLEEFLRQAAENHPSLAQAELARKLSRTQAGLAKATLWPQVAAHGVFEADRQRFVNRGSSNWLAGVSLEWNLWDGARGRAQVAAARAGEELSAALERQAVSAVRLGVLQAYAGLRSATERTTVAERAVAAAEAGHEIIRNRYGAGLTTVTELIRSDAALHSARFQSLAARYEQRVARASLEHAAGVLTAFSPAVQ